MLTHQQNEMLMNLSSIVELNKIEIEPYYGADSAQKFFNYLMDKYHPVDYGRRKFFLECTGVCKEEYYYLRGDPTTKIYIEITTLLRICIGMNFNYQESFLLSWHLGFNLLTDRFREQTYYKILLKLNEISFRNKFYSERLLEAQEEIKNKIGDILNWV